MKWISTLVSSYVRTINFVAVCILAVGLIVGGPVAEVLSGAVSTVFYSPFSKLKIGLGNTLSMATENDRLQLLLREATLRLSNLNEIQRENVRLRNVLNFEPPPGYELLPARVISITGTVAPISAVINRGTRDGVVPGMPVINQAGLVGRVVSSMEVVATIELLTNPTHRVAARVAESREMGIVRYRTHEGMILDNFPILGRIEVGYQVLSSGLGGTYPAGLVIGTVRSVERPVEETFCRVQIDPAANFNTLEELFVLRERRP
jgi:rod shape-determining protein MreC